MSDRRDHEEELKALLHSSAEKTQSVLNLSHRSIKVVPAEMSRLTHVQVLLLNNNNIIMPPEEITHLKGLRHLSLEYNQLTLLPSNLNALGSTLTFLNISHNPLTYLPPCFSELINLKELWLGYTGLSCLPRELSHLVHLQTLSLEGNELCEVDETLNELDNLQWLSLAKNHLRNVDLLHMEGLQAIILAENQLTSFPSTLTTHSNSLVYLDLQKNKIDALPNEVKLLEHIAKIDVRNNPIKDTSPCNHLDYVIL